MLTDLPIRHHWWVCHSGPSVKQQPQVIFLCLFSPALLISCPNGQMSPTHGLNISTSNPGLSFFNPFLPFYSTCTAEDPTQSLRSSSHLLYKYSLTTSLEYIPFSPDCLFLLWHPTHSTFTSLQTKGFSFPLQILRGQSLAVWVFVAPAETHTMGMHIFKNVFGFLRSDQAKCHKE